MTAKINWQGLVVQSIINPKKAANQVVSWRLPPRVLWQTVALVVVVNAILSALSNLVLPVPEPLAGLIFSPLVFALIVALGLIGSVFVLTWIGGILGGTGGFHDMLALLVWLQVLRALAQLVLLGLLLTMPFLASLFVLFVTVATLWIFVNFVEVGLGLRSIWQAIGVVIATAAGIMLGLSLLLSLLGVNLGVSVNV